MCVPPVNGVGVEDVGGLLASMVVFPQPTMAKVAAAKAIRCRARVVFTVSVSTEQDDISALFLMCHNRLRTR